MFFRPEKEKFEDMTKDELVKKIEELHNEIGSSKFGKTDHKWFSLIEHAPNMVVVIDRDHKIQFINHTIPGYDKEEVIGTEVYRHIAPAYHGVAESIINHVFKTGEVSSYENEGAGPYDEHAWYEAQVGPVKSGDEIVAVTLFITDIIM